VIFVTTGTTMPFDELIQEMDRLAAENAFNQSIICQTGTSSIVPSHCEHFKFRPTIDDLIEQADAVITHGGSTVLKLLKMRRPFVAVPNPRGADDHQGELLEALGQEVGLLWTRDIGNLKPLIHKALTNHVVDFDPPCFIDDLVGYLNA